MSPRILLFTSLAAAPIAIAQMSIPHRDTILGNEPLRRLDTGERDQPKSNEVSVVLEDEDALSKSPENSIPPQEISPESKAVEKQNPPPPPTAQPPILVTGRPPEQAEFVVEAFTPTDSEKHEAPEKGVKVRVVDIQGGNGPIDPGQVKLLFPFPPKPLTPAPVGWTYDTTANVPSFMEEVELSPGSKLTLKIHPHVLIPIADGKNIFEVSEPGFDPSLGYQQTRTVGTILATSVVQLEDDSKQLGAAIERLQELLTSLPSPEPESEIPVATPAKEPGPLFPKKR